MKSLLVALLCVVLSSMAHAQVDPAPFGEEQPIDAGIDAGTNVAPALAKAREAVSSAINDGDWSRALAAGEKGIAQHAEDGWLHYLYGSALRITLQREEAGRVLARAGELGPRDVHVVVEQGRLALDLGEMEEAKKLLVEARRLDGQGDLVQRFAADVEAVSRVGTGRHMGHVQDSPEFVVSLLIQDIEEGRLERVISSRMVDSVPNSKAVARGLTVLWQRIASSSTAQFLGWEIRPRTLPERAAGKPVTVHAVWQLNSGDAIYGDGPASVQALLPGAAQSIAAGLSQGEREEYLRRVGELKPLEIVEVQVLSNSRAGQWRLAGVSAPSLEGDVLPEIFEYATGLRDHGFASRLLLYIGFGFLLAVLAAIGIVLSRRRKTT